MREPFCGENQPLEAVRISSKPAKESKGKLRGDERLRNDLIDLLERIGVPGWTRGNLDTHGERCIRSITKALWYIDANHSQFVDRSIKIPELYASFQV